MLAVGANDQIRRGLATQLDASNHRATSTGQGQWSSVAAGPAQLGLAKPALLGA